MTAKEAIDRRLREGWTVRKDNWSILFPSFPGVTSVAGRLADVPRQARDARATIVEDMIDSGEALPPPLRTGSIQKITTGRSSTRRATSP
jgi:predicted RNase H-like HicB family nuclease